MKALRHIRSRTAVLPMSNIDTDQIIPARFLTTTSREGLGRHAFADWRYKPDGQPRPEFALNRPEAQGCNILVAGRNFGCGSSREHAPWALLDYGFQAVVSTELADIFRSNALKNGLLAIVVEESLHERLLVNPGIELDIDIAAGTIALPDGSQAQFPLEEFSRYCILNGVDELGYLLSHREDIERYERTRA